jgi:hypothetical protein
VDFVGHYSQHAGGDAWYRSVLRPRIDSQDAWIFRAPLPTALEAQATFPMGAPRSVRPGRTPLGSGLNTTVLA